MPTLLLRKNLTTIVQLCAFSAFSEPLPSSPSPSSFTLPSRRRLPDNSSHHHRGYHPSTLSLLNRQLCRPPPPPSPRRHQHPTTRTMRDGRIATGQLRQTKPGTWTTHRARTVADRMLFWYYQSKHRDSHNVSGPALDSRQKSGTGTRWMVAELNLVWEIGGECLARWRNWHIENKTPNICHEGGQFFPLPPLENIIL